MFQSAPLSSLYPNLKMDHNKSTLEVNTTLVTQLGWGCANEMTVDSLARLDDTRTGVLQDEVSPKVPAFEETIAVALDGPGTKPEDTLGGHGTGSRLNSSSRPCHTRASEPPKAIESHAISMKTHTWKSNSAKLNFEYQRLRKLISHIAPEQFRNPAKPTDGPCDIVPTTVQEYIEHKRYMTTMSQSQMMKNIEWMKDQIELRKSQKRIKSVLGKEGRVYESGLSPVLAVPTIWSNEFKTLGIASAKWPTQSELQKTRKNQQQQQLVKRQERTLPPPQEESWADCSPVSNTKPLHVFPLDETGPIFINGPEFIEMELFNYKVNNDPEFEETGLMYIGHSLLDVISG